MIVNPQLFSYRLIISSLLVVLTALVIFGITNYNSIKSHETFLKQEKNLVESELSEMLANYDELSEDYNLITIHFQNAKQEAQSALDSLRLLKTDLSVISNYKNKLSTIEAKQAQLLAIVDSLNSANLMLKIDEPLQENSIKKDVVLISELKAANDSLNSIIDNASILKASSVKAQAFRLKSDRKQFTDLAKRTNSIDVCITLAENSLAVKGEKDIYIQIVSPSGNVLSDKGEVMFDASSLIFSKKEVVNYNNKNIEFCSVIAAENDDQPLLKGYYFINVFNKNKMLGSTSIELK